MTLRDQILEALDRLPAEPTIEDLEEMADIIVALVERAKPTGSE